MRKMTGRNFQAAVLKFIFVILLSFFLVYQLFAQNPTLTTSWSIVIPAIIGNPPKFQIPFSFPQDISRLAYENLSDFSTQPNVSWMPVYDNATGVIKFSFTTPNQGVKVTLLKPDWFHMQKRQW